MLNFNDIHSLLLTHQGLFSLPYLPNFMLFLFFSHLKQTHLESSLRLPSPPGFQNFPSNLVETTTIIHLVTTDFPWLRSSPILTALGLWQWMECHLYHYFSVGEIFLSWNCGFFKLLDCCEFLYMYGLLFETSMGSFIFMKEVLNIIKNIDCLLP